MSGRASDVRQRGRVALMQDKPSRHPCQTGMHARPGVSVPGSPATPASASARGSATSDELPGPGSGAAQGARRRTFGDHRRVAARPVGVRRRAGSGSPAAGCAVSASAATTSRHRPSRAAAAGFFSGQSRGAGGPSCWAPSSAGPCQEAARCGADRREELLDDSAGRFGSRTPAAGRARCGTSARPERPRRWRRRARSGWS